MEYELLTEKDQDQIVENTLRNVEQQHFSLSLSRELASASGQPTDAFDENLAALETQAKHLRSRGA